MDQFWFRKKIGRSKKNGGKFEISPSAHNCNRSNFEPVFTFWKKTSQLNLLAENHFENIDEDIFLKKFLPILANQYSPSGFFRQGMFGVNDTNTAPVWLTRLG